MSEPRVTWHGHEGKELRIVWGEDAFQESQRAFRLLDWFEDHAEWCPDVEKRPGEGVADVPSDPAGEQA